MKIAFFSTEEYDKIYFEKYNIYGYAIEYFSYNLCENTVTLAANCQAVCVFVNDKLTQNIIKSLSELGVKLIALRCAGFNNVDLDAATLYGVKVVHVPAYSPHAVAEHTIGMILTLNRKIHKAYNRIREGNFSLNNLLGFDLYQKTVGVIGCGKIGSALVQILLGFGCKVLVNNPHNILELVERGVEFCSLETLFNRSDIISLHCPLTHETHHLISQNSIELMKDGVFLVNTSRGGLIDTKAVKKALINGKISYLAIDVYEQEEQLFFHDLSSNIINDALILELMMYPNVLITAHQGFFTKEALSQIAQTTLTNIYNFTVGKILNEVLPVNTLLT